MKRWQLLLYLLLAGAILAGIATLLLYRTPATTLTIIPPPPTATPAPSVTPGPVRVYVTGAVANPGNTYTLPPNSRVEDAVKLAGGLTLNADIQTVNMAALLHDGDQVNVSVVKVARSGSSDPVLPTASGLIAINSASAKDLERLPGVGAVMAQRIIDYRNKNGPFKSMADIDKIPGVGESRLKEWATMITFE